MDTRISIYEILLNEISAYIFIKDRDRKYVYVNELTSKLFNRDLKQIIGYDDSDFFDLNDASELIANDSLVLDYGKTVTDEEINTIRSTGEVKVYRTVKKPIYNNNNKVIGLLGISTDITDIYNLKEELKKQAATDPLTGLYNRRFFFETAERLFSESNRHGKPLSLIIIDIDLFKNINDSFGHPAGDAVISFVGEHILGILCREDVLARVGGEEFAILLPSTDGPTAQALAEKIRSSMSKQTVSGEWAGIIHPKLSLGVTSRSKGGNTFDEMYLRADSALYTAKNKGRNRVFTK